MLETVEFVEVGRTGWVEPRSLVNPCAALAAGDRSCRHVTTGHLCAAPDWPIRARGRLWRRHNTKFTILVGGGRFLVNQAKAATTSDQQRDDIKQASRRASTTRVVGGRRHGSAAHSQIPSMLRPRRDLSNPSIGRSGCHSDPVEATRPPPSRASLHGILRTWPRQRHSALSWW